MTVYEAIRRFVEKARLKVPAKAAKTGMYAVAFRYKNVDKLKVERYINMLLEEFYD